MHVCADCVISGRIDDTSDSAAPLVIPSLLCHVIQAWGPESVDFFVHTCPWHSTTMQGPDVVDLYEIGLGQQVEELCVDSVDGNAYPLKSFRDFYCVCFSSGPCLVREGLVVYYNG